MIKYIIDNRILSLSIIINTLTAYVFMGVIEDVIVPLCECYLYNFQHKINYHKSWHKIFIMDISFNVLHCT